jgi:uncharacterized membrane protein (UPF0136 family)
LKHADIAAAALVLLPSYIPLIRFGFLTALFQIVIILFFPCKDNQEWAVKQALLIWFYDCFSLTITVFFFLKSVSKRSFFRSVPFGVLLGSASAVLYLFQEGGLAEVGHIALLLTLFVRNPKRRRPKPFIFVSFECDFMLFVYHIIYQSNDVLCLYSMLCHEKYNFDAFDHQHYLLYHILCSYLAFFVVVLCVG